MATAAKNVIVEVDEIVEQGRLNPGDIVTPKVYVDTIVKARQTLTKEGEVKR